ncbi:hypothetical protein HOT75_gp041 [Gordonia phage Daredevil]|uniref:Uncharacterized protein n=1 Tax=Gordonia phage Daredevil TaxID=2283286 RepID=A0A345MIP8_9CAUD|nr:hypothetical protein HOT75_gp041 [Gordonia phage Daredevil]AXH70429.1 hypothetical protein SEA_DAREDEVIL_41 [Gordonia phage Daredevil]
MSKKRAIENLSDTEVYAGFEAVLTWMGAAENAVRMLDAFGENAAAERVEAVLDKLDTVINNAIDGVPNSTPIKDDPNQITLIQPADIVHLASRKGNR